MQPTSPALTHVTTPAGWFPDPWHLAPWRWWDGRVWTSYLTGPPAQVIRPANQYNQTTQYVPSMTASYSGYMAQPRQPRLPAWLSIPVIVASIFVVPLILWLTYKAPLAVLLGLVPLLIVLPAFSWLDRVEPEPRAAKLHAILWGATVAPLVAGILNTLVALVTSEAVSAVVSAPICEETMKGLGVVWAIKRGEVNDIIDGICFAGWVALGFAVSEDFLYLSRASNGKELAVLFFVRALMTPFAHPLFTAWTGLAAGYATAKRKSPWAVVPIGLALAMLTHAAWNGSITWATRASSAGILLVAFGAFVCLFIAAVTMCVVVRNKERKRFVALAPRLAASLGMNASEIALFSTWSGILAMRRALPRKLRPQFDAVHASLARLTSLYSRTTQRTQTDAVEEARHLLNLSEARTRLLQPARS
jgi:protease PrsW